MAFLKSFWKAQSRHKKLSEELALQNAKDTESEQMEMIENENDVITFKLKYLGSTVVEKIQGDNISTEAVKNIIKVAKAGRKKFQRVTIAISLRGIAVSDLQGTDLFKVSIYRISNCSTDPTHRQVFSFISTDANETMECHAFICPKRKMAETVTLAVAHAFGTAYEAWRVLPTTKEFERSVTTKENVHQNHITTNHQQIVTSDVIIEEKLIDFEDEPALVEHFQFDKPVMSSNDDNNRWVCFDDDFAPESRSAFKADLIMA